MVLDNKSKADLALLAFRSCETLRSKQKAVDREYSDRVKKLKKLMVSIASTPEDTTLPGTDGLSLTPDLQKLLLNPTDGL